MAKTIRIRPKLGDIIEIPLRQKYAYALYINYSKVFGELIRVLRSTHSRQQEPGNLDIKDELFCCFFSVGIWTHRKDVRIIGATKLERSDKKMPLFKQYMLNPDTGKKTWFIWEGNSPKAKKVARLSSSQRSYPMAQIIGFDTLVQRIESGWLPEHEV
jgi:hypothetical protein